MKAIWSWIVWVFEKADIIPPIIAVSVWHYAGALAHKDPIPVAIILGGLIDIGHYRSVKAYFKKNTIGRFALMAVFTALTGWYHYLWYQNILLAAGMPVLIIGLAILSTWEGWEKQAGKVGSENRKVAGNFLSEGSGPKSSRQDWRNLPQEDRLLVASMKTTDIMDKYGIPERTARNWRKSAQNGHHREAQP